MPLNQSDSAYYDEKTKGDAVNHPNHYNDGDVETIDGIRAALGPDGFRAYCRGNAMKYIWRAGLKGSIIEDLRKALVYLNWAVGDDHR